MAWVSVWTWPVLAKSYEQKLCRALPYTENCLMEQIKQSARSVVHICICLDEPKRRSCLPWSLLPTPLPQLFPFGALLPPALPGTGVWVPPPFCSQTHFQDSFKQRPLANSTGVPAWCDTAMPGNSPMLSPSRTSAPPSAEAGWRGDLPKHYLELKECGHGGVAA